MKETILSLLLSLPALFIAISIHEYAHGYAAYKMGDPTAKYSGRLSLNPLAHFDLLGSICLLLFKFGWARPVPINPNNFRNRRKGIVLVSLAGPLANFFVAIISAVLLAVFGRLLGIDDINLLFGVSAYYMSGGITEAIGLVVILPMLYYCVILNIGLMIFNLIPIPPLDGSKILFEFLPYKARNVMYNLERHSFLIFILVIYSGILDPVLSLLQNGVFSVITLIMKPFF